MLATFAFLIDICTTVGGPDPNKKCVWPVDYNNFKYSGCIFERNRNPTPWCPTELTSLPERPPGFFIDNKWGSCEPNCIRNGKNQNDII